MIWAFFCLLMLCGSSCVLMWLAWKKITAHMRKHPEAARLVAEHVIAPLLAGDPEETPEFKETK